MKAIDNIGHERPDDIREQRDHENSDHDEGDHVTVSRHSEFAKPVVPRPITYSNSATADSAWSRTSMTSQRRTNFR
jgi:hypothetical protein